MTNLFLITRQMASQQNAHDLLDYSGLTTRVRAADLTIYISRAQIGCAIELVILINVLLSHIDQRVDYTEESRT